MQRRLFRLDWRFWVPLVTVGLAASFQRSRIFPHFANGCERQGPVAAFIATSAVRQPWGCDGMAYLLILSYSALAMLAMLAGAE